MQKAKKKQLTSTAEQYATVLSRSDVDQGNLRKAFDILGLNSSFTHINALVNQLSQSFAYAYNHSKNDNFISEWHKIWSNAKRFIDASPNHFPAQKVPAKGFNTEHPILTAFGREIPVDCDFIHCCRILFFKALWNNEIETNSTKSKEIARQLRLCTVVTDARAEYVRKLKFTKKTAFDDYLNKVGIHLEAELKNGGLSTDTKLLVSSLSELLDFKTDKKTKNKSSKNNSSAKIFEEKTRFQRTTNIDISNSEPYTPITGKIRQIIRQDFSENIFDSPDPIFEAFVDSTNDEFEPNDIANLNRSLRWIHNTRSVSPSSTQRYNRIERANFLSLLRELASGEVETSTVLYLLYLLGLNIDGIWSLKIGTHLSISKKGLYFRTLPTLETAYSPPESIAHLFEEKFECIDLELPQEITTLLKTLKVKHGDLLGDSFTIDRHDMKDQVQSIIDNWRKNGNARFHYNRVTAALSTELMILNNDPLITYLLSGASAHLSPTLRFYRSCSKTYLQSCWNQAMKNLLQLKN